MAKAYVMKQKTVKSISGKKSRENKFINQKNVSESFIR